MQAASVKAARLAAATVVRPSRSAGAKKGEVRLSTGVPEAHESPFEAFSGSNNTGDTVQDAWLDVPHSCCLLSLIEQAPYRDKQKTLSSVKAAWSQAKSPESSMVH